MILLATTSEMRYQWYARPEQTTPTPTELAHQAASRISNFSPTDEYETTVQQMDLVPEYVTFLLARAADPQHQHETIEDLRPDLSALRHYTPSF